MRLVYSLFKPKNLQQEEVKMITAILMESEMLLTAQSELLKTQWNTATSYQTAKAKMIDGLMTEPLD